MQAHQRIKQNQIFLGTTNVSVMYLCRRSTNALFICVTNGNKKNATESILKLTMENNKKKNTESESSTKKINY